MKSIRMIPAATLALLATLVLAGCGGNPLGSGGDSSGSGSITVGSANFPENVLLAQIYAGALRAQGVTVDTKLNIGAREAYIKALQDGSIDLIPEYTGNLLRYFDTKATATDADEVYTDLQKALPRKLTVLDQSDAEDKDAVVVTAATADKLGLSSISDLQGKAGNMVLGGPPEWATRADGVPGLKRVYGLQFQQFKKLSIGQQAQFLKSGQVDAVNIFTTDPAIASNHFVALEDDKNLFAAQRVVPLLTKKADSDAVSEALNSVSGKLDTPTLAKLVAEVVTDKKDPKVVAKSWLDSNGLS